MSNKKSVYQSELEGHSVNKETLIMSEQQLKKDTDKLNDNIEKIKKDIEKIVKNEAKYRKQIVQFEDEMNGNEKEVQQQKSRHDSTLEMREYISLSKTTKICYFNIQIVFMILSTIYKTKYI